jgi:hypothetical protein
MTTTWVKMTLGLLALLTALMGAARFLPHAASPLLDLLAPLPGCSMPCWQGIHPGTTPYEEAIKLLEHNEQIVTIDTRQSMYAPSRRFIWYIYWTWNDHADDTISGSLMIQDGIVRRIRIYKEIPFGMLWALLDRPAQGEFVGTLAYRDSLPTARPLYHVAIYPGSGITIQTDASCAAFWWQPSMLIVGGVTEGGEAYDLAAYRRYACKGWSA